MKKILNTKTIMNIGLNNDEKNWLLTLYSGLRKKKIKKNEITINTIFTPKQIVGRCIDIVDYLSLSFSEEELTNNITPKLQNLLLSDNIRVRNLQHNSRRGDINVENVFRFDSYFSLNVGFGLDDGDLYSASVNLSGYITDSWEDYDVIPFSNWFYSEQMSGNIEVSKIPILEDYIKNNFVILIPKTITDRDYNNLKIGCKNGNDSYSIINRDTPITIPSVADNCHFYSIIDLPEEPLSINFQESCIIDYDETIPIPEPDTVPEEAEEQESEGNVELSPMEIIRGRVDHAVNQARKHIFSLFRGDYSDFDVLNDIKIQLSEKQADILINFKNYIN